MSTGSYNVQILEAILRTTLLLILLQGASATNHSVGGIEGWDLPSDLESWASTATVYTGDNLVFSYGPLHDVLEVNKDSFDNCTISSPISTHNDGETVIPLDKPGTRYFICGTNGHCAQGLKVQVDVLPLQTPPPSPAGGVPPPPDTIPSPPPPPPPSKASASKLYNGHTIVLIPIIIIMTMFV